MTPDSTLTTQLGFSGELQELIMGPLSPAFYIAGLLFAMVAAAVFNYFSVKNRDVHSTDSPRPFSLLYYIRHNWGHLAMSTLAILLLMRFYPELLENFGPGTFQKYAALNMGICALLGVLFPALIKAAVWRVNKGKYEILANTTKQVMFLISGLNDTVKSINGIEYNKTIDQLTDGHKFWLDVWDGSDVLCTEIPRTIPLIKGEFISAKTAETYIIKSQNK